MKVKSLQRLMVGAITRGGAVTIFYLLSVHPTTYLFRIAISSM